jgi:hypothetical protein
VTDTATRPNRGGRKAEPIKHGTYGGYQTHQRRKVPVCDDCRQAAADYRSSRQSTGPRKPGSAPHDGPHVRCGECRQMVPVLHPIDGVAARMALLGHLNDSPTCARAKLSRGPRVR